MKKNSIIFIFCFLLLVILILIREKIHNTSLTKTSSPLPKNNKSIVYWERWLALR